MLEGIIVIFEDYKEMLKKLKKKQYEERTIYYKREFGHFFDEMNEYIENSEDRQAAYDEISNIICDAVKTKYTKFFGRISGRVILDLSFHLLFFVFPTILAYEKDYSAEFANRLREIWNERFKQTIVECADYTTLHDSFNEKFFGISLDR